MEIFKLWGSILVNSDDAEKSISRTEDKAKKFSSGLGEGMKTAAKWGAAIATGAAAAGAGIFAITKPLVESAAKAQAMNAQFEQVFGDMQADAQSTVDGLGEKFGMLPNRIKPALTVMTSMFKGLGMDSETAMSTAAEAVTVVADAAAFYDKSFEDANAALNSFIKGNYEGGESIGLFANETQLAAYASSELGLEWKNLDEAGKQVARLEYAQAMQEAAGATGQAARESGSLENVMGNLRQAWEDVKVKFGEPILEPAINMIQGLTQKILDVDVDSLVAKVEAFGAKAMEVFEKVKTAVKFVIDNMNVLLPIVTGLTGAIVAQMVINSLVGAYKAWQTATKTQTTLQWLLNAALNANPLGLVALAIGAVIAAGVLLWKNWDTVKAKTTELWSTLTEKFSAIRESVVGKMEEVRVQALAKFLAVYSAMVDPVNRAKDGIKNAIDSIKSFFSNLTLKLPDIKTPHFRLKNWSINPVDWLSAMPSIAIDWYKEGGIMTKPTVFGMDGHRLMAGGEAGPEAILPLNNQTLGSIGDAIARTMDSKLDNITVVVQSVLDGKVVSESTYPHIMKQYKNDMQVAINQG